MNRAVLDAPSMTRPALNDLIALACEAGREILAVREAGFDPQKKLDGSPVTIADQRAEAIIERGLKTLAPGVPMLGEEAFEAGRIPDCSGDFFCVDALDGTRGFVKGGDQFTVNIGLIEQCTPVVGVVLAPASGELYAGEPGRAFKGRIDVNAGARVEELEPIRTAAQKAQSGWRIVASDYSGRNEQTKAFVEALNGVTTHASSSIKFCRLAEGEADLYPRFGNISEWDASAGHAVLSAAGGGVMDLHGAPLRYGKRDDKFLIRGFIAFASAEAAAAARGALTR